MKKIISIFLSVLMVITVMPLSAMTAFAAAPSTTKKATSVAAVSDYDYSDSDIYYYFDSLQEAFDYEVTDNSVSFVTLLKDIELDSPAVLEDNDDSGDSLSIELNGHSITAPNGNAIELNNMYRNTFINFYKQYYDGGDAIEGYGGIYAKDYAVVCNDMSLVICGGTYSSQTKKLPFVVTDNYDLGAICNIRQCAIIKNNTQYNGDGTFGDDGNTYLRYKTVDGVDDHFYYFHVAEKQVDGEDAYVVEEHKYTYVTDSIAPDSQSAHVSYKCDCGLTKASVEAEALIGDTGYVRLSQALAAVGDGEAATIEVLKDCSITSIDINNGKNITIDMNGHTFTQNSGYIIPTGGALTIKNGYINSKSNNIFVMKGTDDPAVTDYTTLVVDNMVINNTYEPSGAIVFIDNPLTNWSKPDNCYGINVSISDSTLTSTGVSLLNNGNYDNIDNPMHIDINNSTLESKNYLALYIAGYAIVNTTASSYTGQESGAEIRAGVFNINGDDNTFTTNYTGEFEAVPNHSGTTTSGAALAIAQHNLQPKPNPILVNVYGGTFNGVVSVSESMVENIAPKYVDVKLNIYGGEFNATDTAVISDTCTGFISGGTFTTEPNAEYISDGLAAYDNEDGTHTVGNLDLDWTAFDAAVTTAKSINRAGYTAESIAAMDATLVDASTLKSQKAIDNATDAIQTAINNLVRIECTVTFDVQGEADLIDTNTFTCLYGDTVVLDASVYEDTTVYKWTIESNSATTMIPTVKPMISSVITGDTVITAYLNEKDPNADDDNYVAVKFESKNGAVIDIKYAEKDNIDSVELPSAPEIPFYSFDGWVKVDDTTFKASYEYSYRLCRVIGNSQVLVNGFEQIDIPYDEVVNITKIGSGRLALSLDGTEENIITYLDNEASFHCPMIEHIYVILVEDTQAKIGITGYYATGTKQNSVIGINAQYYLPAGCTFVECGAIVTANETKTRAFKSNVQNKNHEYTIEIASNVSAVTSMKAKAYVVYIDANGEKVTLESDDYTPIILDALE